MQALLVSDAIPSATDGCVWRASADATAAYRIHAAALALSPAGLVRPDPLSHFENHIRQEGCMLGCTHPTAGMIGYGILGIDSSTAAHLATLLGADPMRFAILDGAAALPQWRGHGLHQQAIDERVACADARGRTVIGATVAPNNLRAMHSIFRAGFQIRRFVLMYGGLERLLVMRDTQAAPYQGRVAVRIAASDSQAHQAALAQGLRGIDFQRAPDGSWSVGYGPSD